MLDSRYLQLIVLSTEQCNFRCTYCYETFERGALDERTALGLRALIAKRAPDLEVLELSWFGGEPLLEYQTVLGISAFAREMCARHNTHFRSDITTNGSLLSVGRLKSLVDSGVSRYQITLDGTPETHDTLRVNAAGQGTARGILRHLRQALATELDFNLLLRIHLHPQSEASLDGLITLIQKFDADPRVDVLVRPIADLGGPNSGKIDSLNRIDADRLLNSIQEKLHNRVQALNPAAPDAGAAPCYAAKANSFVIRSDGAVGKCTVALDDDRNVVGQLTPEGSLNLDSARVRPWIRGISSGDELELHCPLINLTS